MKIYAIQKVIGTGADGEPMLDRNWVNITAETPAKARKVYAEKTGYTGKVKATFVSMAIAH